MAFPTVAATTSNFDTTSDTSYNVTLPAGVSAGDLLIAFCWVNSPSTTTPPTGWTLIATGGDPNSQHTVFLAYKVASGSETSPVAFGGTNSRASWGMCYRITGFTGTPEATADRVALGVPNPPSLTASWGSDNNLWLAVGGQQNTVGTLTPPTNYGSEVNHSSGRALQVAQRNLAGATDDPGDFGASNDQSTAGLVVIRGAAAAAATGNFFQLF